MKEILIRGGGASGLAAAISAAQTGGKGVRVTLVDQNPAPGKKLLATGNGRCNLDNAASSDPGRYFTASPGALAALLGVIDQANVPGWWEKLGLVTRTDEEGRLYPYSNQAADLTGLLLRGYRPWASSAAPAAGFWSWARRAAATPSRWSRMGSNSCSPPTGWSAPWGGSAGPQFGTGGFGPALARRCGGKCEPLYPCLTPIRCGDPALLQKLSGLLGPGHRHPPGRGQASGPGERRNPVCQLWPVGHLRDAAVGAAGPGPGPCKARPGPGPLPGREAPALADLFARRAAGLPDPGAFWQGLLDQRLGDALWAAAGLGKAAPTGPDGWRALAALCKGWRFENPTLCGWKQAQTTGGGLSLEELEPDFQLKGCRGLYFVGETLDCAAAAAASTFMGLWLGADGGPLGSQKLNRQRKPGRQRLAPPVCRAFFRDTGAGISLPRLLLLLFVLVGHGLLVEDLAQRRADDIQQAHGQSHHGLGNDIGRGDHSRHKEDQNDHDAAGLVHQLGADNAHPGQDDDHQRHLKDRTEDQKDGDAELM